MKKSTKSSSKAFNSHKDLVPNCPVLTQIEFTGVVNPKETAKVKNQFEKDITTLKQQFTQRIEIYVQQMDDNIALS